AFESVIRAFSVNAAVDRGLSFEIAVQGQGARRFVKLHARIEIEAVADRGPIPDSSFGFNLRRVRFQAQPFDLDAVFGDARRQTELAEPVFAARVTDATRFAVELQVDDALILRPWLGGRLGFLDVSLDSPRQVFEMDRASVDHRYRAFGVDSDRFRFRRDVMDAVQIRPALAVDLIVEIRASEFDFFDYDLATRLQRQRIADRDQRIEAPD